MAKIETTPQLVAQVYEKLGENIQVIKARLGRPLTLAEKVLFGHLQDPKTQDLTRGESFLMLYPDRVAMQDATAQMALLQFMLSGRQESAVPATVHCDHLILAYKGLEEDLKNSMTENQEVFDFLASASSRYGIGFWRPGSGIIHQVVLENYAFPGGLMIGTDSHTPNAGGLGMLAVGVGGADASDVMAGLPWEVKNPKLIGVKLTGKLGGWASAKDVILKLCGILTVKGGTNKIVEYFGPGCESISCTGKATITNMGAELGATCSVFPFDRRMEEYLKMTNREDLAKLACENKELLEADREVSGNPEKFYDEIVEIDLSKLQPHLVGPHSPDIAHSLSDLKKKAKASGWPLKLSAALVGSCTNSSYEDIGRATYVAKQALDKGLKMPQQFMLSPGSAQIKKTIERDGHMETLKDVGATVLANACGPCIGQWKRDDYKQGEVNTIVSSFNRNFRGRNDANLETLSFLGSPEVVMALGLAGRLDFDPETDEIETPQGPLKLKPPVAEEFPDKGFIPDFEGYQSPKGATEEVKVNPESKRLQLLSPFLKRTSGEYQDMVVLCKASGKCTTDHISPAGFWLRFRGHLANISDNMLKGANNAFSSKPGYGSDPLGKSEEEKPLSEQAKSLKAQGQPWVIVGDDNYGEGSSREHAAMSPRFLGAAAVVAKSFARIHETNLKKQGVLALVFENPKDYDLIGKQDRLAIPDIESLAPQKPLTLKITHEDGSEDSVKLRHSFNKEQVKWFWAGSALNFLRQ